MNLTSWNSQVALPTTRRQLPALVLHHNKSYSRFVSITPIMWMH